MAQIYKGEIGNIIALCHIIDDFEEFEKKLIPMISPKYNRDFVFQLWDISRGKFKIGARKAKKFYSANKEIIDTINQYTNITRFICDNYSYHGKPNGDLEFFYKYISIHKEEIKSILAILRKLDELGFRYFKFSEELDFTKEVYSIYPSFNRNFDITYVANAEVIPNYENHIYYKTPDSNYKMKLDLLGVTEKEFSDWARKIELNSLLFDPNTLPQEINRENTHGQLLKLSKEQEEKSSIIKNSVDLSISVSDLEQQFNYTSGIISSLNGVKNKEELVAALTSIKEDLEKLKTLSLEHDSNISQENPSLTPEVLEIEKSSYLKRRKWESIDLC